METADVGGRNVAGVGILRDKRKTDRQTGQTHSGSGLVIRGAYKKETTQPNAIQMAQRTTKWSSEK